MEPVTTAQDHANVVLDGTEARVMDVLLITTGLPVAHVCFLLILLSPI